MKKQTIAQMREKAVHTLLSRNTEMTFSDANKAMNAYYRLAGMDERLLYLENDERTCNRQSTKDLAERRDIAFKRVNEYFKPFNACLVYFGYLPTICELGSTQDLYLRHFYN